MKYRLKKDLPFAKAGAEVQIDADLIFVETDPELYREVDFRSIAYSKDKDRLISEGWIEEVKPREWYELEVWVQGEWIYTGNRYSKEYLAREAVSNRGCAARFIKVREVIK